MSLKSMYQLLIPVISTIATFFVFMILSLLFLILYKMTDESVMRHIKDFFYVNIFKLDYRDIHIDWRHTDYNVIIFWIINATSIVIAEVSYTTIEEEKNENEKETE